MNKIKIIGRLVLIALSIMFISFVIETNSGTFFHVSAAGAIIFWSLIGIWRDITGGKKAYLVWKDGRPKLDMR